MAGLTMFEDETGSAAFPIALEAALLDDLRSTSDPCALVSPMHIETLIPNGGTIMTQFTPDPRDFLTDLFKEAVAVADPMRVVAAHLPVRPAGRLVVIGAGKASARMAEAVETHYGRCDGLVVTRYGYQRPTKGMEIVQASHPVPDASGEVATKRMLNLVSGLSADDTSGHFK